MKDLHNLLIKLSSLKQFRFLDHAFFLNNQLKNTVLNSDIDKISKYNKPYDLNFFVDQATLSYYPIDEPLAYEFLKILLFDENIIFKNNILLKQLENCVQNIFYNTNIIKVNKEILLFEILINKKIGFFTINLYESLLEILIKEITKDKMHLNSIKFKYTDMCFKLGEFLIKFYLENIKCKISTIKNNIKDIYINIFYINKNLTSFLEFAKKKNDNLLLKQLVSLFNITNKKTANYLYKVIRTFFIFKKYEKKDKIPQQFSKIHHEYTTYLIKLGCLLLESLIENKIFSKSYLNIKNNNIKKPLIVIFNEKLLKSPLLKSALHRPFLTENIIPIYINNIKEKILLTEEEKKEKEEKEYMKELKDLKLLDKPDDSLEDLDWDFLELLMRPFRPKIPEKLPDEKEPPILDFSKYPEVFDEPRSLKGKEWDWDISYILDLLLYNIYNSRKKKFIGSNFDMTTEIKKESYLNNKNNLSTKFVIDTDYLYSFLNLLKYHMFKKKKDFEMPFIERLKNHENIFLLYQITIDSIIKFYNKYKEIVTVKNILNKIIIYILDYNIDDDDHIIRYKEKLLLLKKNKKINLSFTQKKKIEIFITDLFNKIFSYKIFIKGLLTECILYSNFRYFILDSFIDTRGRCYYNGFYLNPQSYPITKAFVKLYNPTQINETQYSKYLYPFIKKHIISNTYKDLLDKDLNSYTKFINKQNLLRQEYLNSLLNTNINIDKDIIENFKNIINPVELSRKTLEFIKPKINKIKKLYIVHSIIIRILHPQREIQNYYELDAVASGLQMTAMLFQNKRLAEICNLITNQEDQIDIYEHCSLFLIKNLDFLEVNLNKIFAGTPNFIFIKDKLIKLFDDYLNKTINLLLMIKETEMLIGNIENLFESIADKEKFFVEHFWIITNFMKKNFAKMDKQKLYYLIILKGLKMNILRKEFTWLDDWIKSRDFCKKSIMTFGYNATEYRRKLEWMTILLKLNDYERRTDLYFITDISENLFSFITFTKLNPSNWLRHLGNIIKNQIELNFSKKILTENTSTNVIIENSFLKIKLHCYKQIVKRIDVKGSENKRKHQLTVKYPKYIEKIFQNSKSEKNVYSLKEQNYNLLNRKFTPNFIHSMDAFLVHIFKQKIFAFSSNLNRINIFINHMTNHDNFALTLEPFLKILLMDCYNLLYKYDYIHTLNTMDCYNLLIKFRLDCQKTRYETLPGSLYEKRGIFIPSDLNLSNNFVK